MYSQNFTVLAEILSASALQTLCNFPSRKETPLKGVKSIAWGIALRIKANSDTCPDRAQSF